jgi:hypothetical protein
LSSELRRYFPCLRWKQGEYQAMLRLSEEARAAITPIIEIAEVGYDFETRQCCKSIDEHLAPIAKRVVDKWGHGHCLVDLRHIDLSQSMADGANPISFVFGGLRIRGVPAVPVIGLAQSRSVRTAVQGVAAEDRRGACVRISLEELGSGAVRSSMSQLLSDIQLAAGQCDLVLDLGAPNFEPLEGFTKVLVGLIPAIPYLTEWRSFVMIGTSFPASMAELPLGLSRIVRREWLLYKSLLVCLREGRIRPPSFGDYGISHPEIPRADMRFVKPSASVRYTVADGWLVARGPNVRDHKFGQYRGLCRSLLDSGSFDEGSTWFGDLYIASCAMGQASTGTLTTWRQVGTNRHVEKVVRDVASFADSEAGP